MGRDISELVVSVVCLFGKGREWIRDVKIEGNGDREDRDKEEGRAR